MEWTAEQDIALYPHQEEAVLEVAAGNHCIVNTPTGSGKSLIALGAHAVALATGRRTFYTAPIKALVSEKFFALCHQLGSKYVGMMTGDAAVNAEAPVICCTAEIVANMALRHGGTARGLGGPYGTADIGQVVMDEFHYYGDPDRGWAWQVPLVELPHAQMVLMSATLGDTSRIAGDLERRTGRTAATITSVERPVPLDYRYSGTAIHHTIEELVATGRAPVYIVHFTQAQALERAQALASINVTTKEQKAAIAETIGHFRFSSGFGKTLSRLVRMGIGVHHAGMLPKYRLLVERLAQEGHLKVICGTDTLGVGVNVPIRTVLFTGLSKYDGTQSRVLSAREFHQIAGRAGRAGFDTEGSVVVQAPAHEIEHAQAKAKAGGDTKKLRKVTKPKPPRGYVPWSEDTFNRLVKAPPEPLQSQFKVSHAMLIEVLDRPGDGCGQLKHLLFTNDETPQSQRKLARRAISMYRSLLAAGTLERLDTPDDQGRRVRVTFDLQEDFALNQPLSPFVLAALPALEAASTVSDLDAETRALNVMSLVESTLENPMVILLAQLDKAKGEALAEMKRAGVEYDDRMSVLEKMEWPKPLREFLYDTFDAYRAKHPWVEDNIKPKSVARDLYERAMGFNDYIRHYGVARSEGLLLRYLSDTYKTLVQNVPDDAKSDELWDLIEWLGELVRQVDSSLIDEWEKLRNPEDDAGSQPPAAAWRSLETGEMPRLTNNLRAFRVMVRNLAFRHVELLSRRDWDALADTDEAARMKPSDWAAAAAPYFSVHPVLGIGPDARGGSLFQVEEGQGQWLVRQVLDDPDGDRDWALLLTVDLAASDENGTPVITAASITDLP